MDSHLRARLLANLIDFGATLANHRAHELIWDVELLSDRTWSTCGEVGRRRSVVGRRIRLLQGSCFCNFSKLKKKELKKSGYLILWREGRTLLV